MSKIDFSFLKSNRFWAMLGGCIVIAAEGGFSWDSVIKALQVFVAGFITIRTLDRATEVLARK